MTTAWVAQWHKSECVGRVAKIACRRLNRGISRPPTCDQVGRASSFGTTSDSRKVLPARWVCPPPCQPDDFGPGSFREGWQNEAASIVERQFGCETLSRRMSDPTELSSGRRLGPELACLCPAITHHFARIEPVSFAWSSCDVSTCPFASSLRTCFF